MVGDEILFIHPFKREDNEDWKVGEDGHVCVCVQTVQH